MQVLGNERAARWWHGRQPLPLSWYLVAIIGIATLPLAVLAGYLVLQTTLASQAQLERSLRYAASALASAVERELAASNEVLHTFQVTTRAPERPALERELTRLLGGRADWIGAFLLDNTGKVVAARGDDRALAMANSAGGEQIRFAPNSPTNAYQLIRQRVGGDELSAIAIPLVTAPSAQIILCAVFQPDKWQLLLDHQASYVDGLVALVDRERRVVARADLSAQHAAPGTVEFPIEVVDTKRTQGLERIRPRGAAAAYVAWQAVGATGWHAAVQLAAEPIDRRRTRLLMAVLLGGAAAFAIGLAGALLVSRGVTSPLARLAEGLRPQVTGGKRSTVAEIERLTHALEVAQAERDADRAALQAKADEFETLFRRTPIGLAIATDRECRNVLGNAALMALLGLREGDPLSFAPWGDQAGRWFDADTTETPLAPSALPLQRAAAQGEAVQGHEYTVVRADGTTVQVQGYAAPLRAADGSPRGAIGAFVDVTDQRQADRQRAAALVNEQQARQDAEIANRSKDEFLALFNHELRNPLSAIASATEVLNRIGGQKPDEVRARDVIRRQIHHLTRMMEDLLDVTRVVNGKITLSRAPIDLAAAVQRSASALNLTGRLRDHRVELNLDPTWINADGMRIEQIISNLLTNAAKYTPGGGTIDVLVAAEGEAALLAVSDTGVGIRADMLDRVFDLFVQAERGSARRQGGLGIGLTLVKRLAEIHGGSVVAHSAGIDRGSRFEVRIPRIPPPQRL